MPELRSSTKAILVSSFSVTRMSPLSVRRICSPVVGLNAAFKILLAVDVIDPEEDREDAPGKMPRPIGVIDPVADKEEPAYWILTPEAVKEPVAYRGAEAVVTL